MCCPSNGERGNSTMQPILRARPTLFLLSHFKIGRRGREAINNAACVVPSATTAPMLRAAILPPTRPSVHAKPSLVSHFREDSVTYLPHFMII
jgi:hypothetical protein